MEDNSIITEGVNRSNYSVFVRNNETGKINKIGFNNKMVDETIKTKPKHVYKQKKNAMYLFDQNMSDMIEEAIEPSNADVQNFTMKDTLNPFIWDEKMDMYPEIRNLLLKNAYEFIKYAKIDTLKFNDIILTGSLSNYNYNEYSDLDVHIILDYNQISTNTDFVREFLDTKKDLWRNKLNIQIKGHDVEIYVQDDNDHLVSTGVYSIMFDQWILKPIKKFVSIDVLNVKEKAFNLMKLIDNIDEINDDNQKIIEIGRIKNKIKKLRQAGLDKDGEFSSENLTFKILRNNGYLQKLTDAKENILKAELNLESVNHTN